MGLDPSSPEMTFILVMLHTGTMFAVIFYFWNSWVKHYFSSKEKFLSIAYNVIVATLATGVLGVGLQYLIEKVALHANPNAEVEDLFSQLPLIGAALLVAGILIFISGFQEERSRGTQGLSLVKSLIIGLVQGLCLPFRGFSRSGATISTGLLFGIERRTIEEFSFALAVVITPAFIVKEWLRLVKAHPESAHKEALIHLLTPGLFGMLCSFGAGFAALYLLSSLLEAGRWKYFGIYCVLASAVVFVMAYKGF
jgi:undecaprenyl-diphosphatase